MTFDERDGLLWQCNHFQVLNFRMKTINHSPCSSEVWLISLVHITYGHQGQMSQNDSMKKVLKQ